MTILNSNKPVWFNKDGGILANGSIWVGEENKASNNFNVTVTFEDSAGTLTTAEQPLRTDDSGRIVYLGTPIIATVAVTHSLLILNSAQKQVDYIPSVEAGSVAGTAITETYNTEAEAVADTSLDPGTHVVTLSKTTLFSGGGADWVVITFSGTPGDGDLVVDLDNGTQLKKLFNQLYTGRNLGEIATAGTVAQQATRDNLAPALSGYTKSSVHYFESTGNSQSSVFDIEGTLTKNVWASIGKTGSGADFIWTALNIIPANSRYIDIKINASMVNSSINTANIQIRAIKNGTTRNTDEGNLVYDTLHEGTTTFLTFESLCVARVPVSDAIILDMLINHNTTGAGVASMYLVGFGS